MRLPNPLRLAIPALLAAACQGKPDDLREWRAADHAQPSEGSPDDARRAPAQVPEGREAPPPGLEDVTIAAWRRSCLPCHGTLGRGDGPQSAMTRPRDLSDPAWQASVTDESIAETIRLGRGRMARVELPPATIGSIVKLVRLFDRSKMGGPPPASAGAPASPAAGSATPGAPPPAPAGSPGPAGPEPPR